MTRGHFKFLLEVDELLSNRLIAKRKSELGEGGRGGGADARQISVGMELDFGGPYRL